MDFKNGQKVFDLEQRTFLFSKAARDFCRESLKYSLFNSEYTKQLIRSSGSVAANYIEANEALSKKDFIMRIKICRKEAKESGLWLGLIEIPDSLIKTRDMLLSETTELRKIFSRILEVSTKN